MMRKIIHLALCILVITISANAQAPERFQYQTVVRDNSGNPIANQNVGFRINIHRGSSTGAVDYSETHNATTNDFGLVNLELGGGTSVSGSFNTIDWEGNIYFVEVELDPSGGSAYSSMGTTQLLSVPYALSSKKASGMDLNDLVDVQGNPANGEVLKWNGTTWAPAIDSAGLAVVYTAGSGVSISGSNVISADLGTDISTNEIQSNAVTNAKIANSAVGTNQLANSSVTTAKLDNGAVSAPKLGQMSAAIGEVLKWNGAAWAPAADNTGPASVTYTAGTGVSISGSNVVSADLGVDIATAEIQNDAVTNAKIANNAVNTAQIANSAVTSTKIDQMSATNGEVLKWNGTNWAPAADSAGSNIWSLSGSDAYYNSGDVGIGTSSPSAKLEISQNSSLSDPHIHIHEDGNDYARIKFDNNNSSNYWTIAAYVATNNRNDRLNFWNGTSGDLMSLTGDGRLGIGVGISPRTTLHVGNGETVLFGSDTIGPGDKLLWLPKLHAFRVGTVASGATANYWHPDSIGLYSFASGLNTRAQGYGATAMGRNTEASNSYAFASGFFSNADGQYSTAMGFNTDAEGLGSTALGYSTDAEANYSFAAGFFAEAQAIYSVALGYAVQAQSYASMAVGRYNVGGGNATSWQTNDPIFEIGIGTGPSTRANALTVRKDGNVGIGITNPLDALHINGRIRFATIEYLEDGGSSEIAANGDLRPTTNNVYDLGTSAFRWDDVYATNGTINTSDRRDKTNIRDLPYGLTSIMALKPVVFQWKEGADRGDKLGLIAQDLLLEIPEVVKTYDYQSREEDGVMIKQELERLGVYYSDLIPVLIKATQEQQQEIELLKQQIELLKTLVEKD